MNSCDNEVPERSCSLSFREDGSVSLYSFNNGICTFDHPLWKQFVNYLNDKYENIATENKTSKESFENSEKRINSYTQEVIDVMTELLDEFRSRHPDWQVYSENEEGEDEQARWTFTEHSPQLYVCDNCTSWGFSW